MEDDIKLEKILKKIEDKDIRTKYDIEEIKNEKLNFLLKKYGHYENNKKSIKNIKEDLEDYEFIDSYDLLSKRDSIYIVFGDQFFDIKGKYMGKYFKYNENTNRMLLRYDYNRWIELPENRYVFRKLNKKDKLKIMLIEAINEIN